MTKIYSRVDPKLLLHIIHRRTDFGSERNDLVEDKNFLQCAAMKLPEGKTFKPHAHGLRESITEVRTNESWVIISGSVRAILYDIDRQVLACPVLNPGDCSITIGEGGHTYEVIQTACVLEFKNGQYKGQAVDKYFI